MSTYWFATPLIPIHVKETQVYAFGAEIEREREKERERDRERTVAKLNEYG